MQLPLSSSALLIKILLLEGLVEGNTYRSGSHRTYKKYVSGEKHTLVRVVLLNNREIARGTGKYFASSENLGEKVPGIA